MIAGLDLNLVLTLHVVLAERNVARAAERLHVTPSAVSNALARLRSALGDPLVTRRGRGVVPTPRAAELAPVLARAIGEIEGALATGPFDPARTTRSFTLAVADPGQLTWVPDLAVALRREMPLARLHVVSIDALVSLGDLGSGEVDVHVGMPADGPGIHAAALHDEACACVARRSRGRVALADRRHVRVDMVPGRSPRDAFAACFRKARIPREIVVTVPSFTAAAEVVARSDLVTMLPRSLLAAKGKTLGLVALDLPMPEPVVPIAMCWHERTHHDAAARAFRALVRRVVGARASSARR